MLLGLILGLMGLLAVTTLVVSWLVDPGPRFRDDFLE